MANDTPQVDLSKSISLNDLQAAPQSNQSIHITGDVPNAPSAQVDLSKSIPLNDLNKLPGEKPPEAMNLPAEVGKGILKGVGQTTSGVGEAVHAIPVVGPKVIPEKGLQEEERMATPTNVPQQVGTGLEAIGEFVGGDELLKGLSTMANLGAHAPELLKLIENNPKTAKLILGTLKGATVGGAQGATKGAATGEGAKAGGEAGAIGGALGEPVGEVAGGLIGKLGSTSFEDAMKAAKPSKWNLNFMQDWETSAPRFLKEIKADGKFADMGDAAERMREATNKVWTDEIKNGMKNVNGKNLTQDVVNTDPVYDAVKNLPISRFRQGSQATLDKIADQFNPSKLITVEQLEKDIEDLNAEVAAKGYWSKPPKERAALLKVDPEVAGYLTAANAAREQLYTHLEKAGMTNIKELKNLYGAMSNVTQAVEGQSNVVGRQAPITLKQLVGLASGIASGTGKGLVEGIAIPLVDKLYNEPTALLNRALQKSAGPTIAQKAISAAKTTAEHAPSAVGAQAAQWVRMQAGNRVIEVHPEDVAEAEKLGASIIESSSIPSSKLVAK